MKNKNTAKRIVKDLSLWLYMPIFLVSKEGIMVCVRILAYWICIPFLLMYFFREVISVIKFITQSGITIALFLGVIFVGGWFVTLFEKFLVYVQGKIVLTKRLESEIIESLFESDILEDEVKINFREVLVCECTPEISQDDFLKSLGLNYLANEKNFSKKEAKEIHLRAKSCKSNVRLAFCFRIKKFSDLTQVDKQKMINFGRGKLNFSIGKLQLKHNYQVSTMYNQKNGWEAVVYEGYQYGYKALLNFN